MILLDITANEFIKRHPGLEGRITELCNEHKFNINNIQPYLTQEMIGVILNPEAKEGRRRVFTHRDENKSEEYGNILANTLLEQT